MTARARSSRCRSVSRTASPFGHEVGQLGEDHRLTGIVVARLDQGQVDGHEFGETVDQGSDQEAAVLGIEGLGNLIDGGCRLGR